MEENNEPEGGNSTPKKLTKYEKDLEGAHAKNECPSVTQVKHQTTVADNSAPTTAETSSEEEDSENKSILESIQADIKYKLQRESSHKFENCSKQILQKIRQGQYELIDRFLLELHEKELQFKRSNEEVKDITKSVDEMVENITSSLGALDPKYEISHRYLVGSMKEGTRIIDPDEFDYLLVLKHLSSDYIELELEQTVVDERDDNCLIKFRNHSDTFKHVHVRPKHTSDLWPFSSWIESGYLHNGCVDSYNSFGHPISHFFYSLPKITKLTGCLLVESCATGVHGPACMIELKWIPADTNKAGLPISVDLTPAIEIHGDVGNVVRPKDVYAPQFYKQLLEDNKYLLVSINSWDNIKCFNYTFTLTEVKLTEMLSENHKICYKIMKFFITSFKDDLEKIYSSYFLKTIVLKHAVHCSYNDGIVRCLLDIISKIFDSCRLCTHGDNEYSGESAYLNELTIFRCSNKLSEKSCNLDKRLLMTNALAQFLRQLLTINQLPYNYTTHSTTLLKYLRKEHSSYMKKIADRNSLW